jgi:hypothetical protein
LTFCLKIKNWTKVEGFDRAEAFLTIKCFIYKIILSVLFLARGIAFLVVKSLPAKKEIMIKKGGSKKGVTKKGQVPTPDPTLKNPK